MAKLRVKAKNPVSTGAAAPGASRSAPGGFDPKPPLVFSKVRRAVFESQASLGKMPGGCRAACHDRREKDDRVGIRERELLERPLIRDRASNPGGAQQARKRAGGFCLLRVAPAGDHHLGRKVSPPGECRHLSGDEKCRAGRGPDGLDREPRKGVAANRAAQSDSEEADSSSASVPKNRSPRRPKTTSRNSEGAGSIAASKASGAIVSTTRASSAASGATRCRASAAMMRSKEPPVKIFEAVRKANPWLPRESQAGAFETPGIGIDNSQPSAVRICQCRRVPRQRPMANLQDP